MLWTAVELRSQCANTIDIHCTFIVRCHITLLHQAALTSAQLTTTKTKPLSLSLLLLAQPVLLLSIITEQQQCRR
jgi:hypothetical protein